MTKPGIMFVVPHWNDLPLSPLCPFASCSLLGVPEEMTSWYDRAEGLNCVSIPSFVLSQE